MPTFGIIAEGATDQAVIENILIGFFGEEDGRPTRVQPPDESPGGWTLVFRALREGKHREALQFNDYVIIHIDTDVCEEPGFDVPRREAGQQLTLDDLMSRVEARLAREMTPDFLQKHGHRVVFAVAVDSIECWLLPLLWDKPGQRAKITGCLHAVNNARIASGQKPISTMDFKNKYVDLYDDVSTPYAKRRTLQAHATDNPSLRVFVERLGAIPVVPPAGDDPPTPEDADSMPG